MITIENQLDWAAAIARRVAAKSFLRGSHLDDLVSVAHLHIVELFQRFDLSRCPPNGDPEGLFRGWASRAVYTVCIDEAKRLRAGGLIRKRRRKPVVCSALGEMEAELEAREELDLEEPIKPPSGVTASRPLVRARSRMMLPRSSPGRRLVCGGG